MRLIATANITNGKETIGFRLLDVDTKQVKDAPILNVQNVLKSGTVQIENLKVKANKVIGSNGSIDRLPKIINGQLVGKSPLIVLNQIEDEGYIVSDYKGTIATLKNQAAISYAKENGIVNGKIVTKDGKEFISSISGTYPIINATKPKNTEDKKEAPKNDKIDYDKLKPLGCFYLKCGTKYTNGDSTSGVFSAFLMEYDNNIVYIPSMNLGVLKRNHNELFNIFENWCNFSIYKRDLESDASNFGSIVAYHNKYSLPDYELPKNEKLYNIFTYLNSKKNNRYYAAYGLEEDSKGKRIAELIYLNNNFIAENIHSLQEYKYAWFERNNKCSLVDFKNNKIEEYDTDKILRASEKYVVIATVQHGRENSVYFHKVFRRQDKELVYYNYNGVSSEYLYKFIGDRYFVTGSYNKGITDLDTGKLIQYPFENVCKNFICNVTNETYTDQTGVHKLDEMPNIRWTGYEEKEFIKKFGGFVPESKAIGWLDLHGFGGFQSSNSSKLVFKNINNGIFYRKGSKLENIITGEMFDVDDIMVSWIKKSERANVIEKRPKDTKRFSIIEILNNDGNVYGLTQSSYGLRFEGKILSTSFLKEKVNFTPDKLLDVILSISDIKNMKGKVEIKCKIGNKKVTFETNLKYDTFEVADIA